MTSCQGWNGPSILCSKWNYGSRCSCGWVNPDPDGLFAVCMKGLSRPDCTRRSGIEAVCSCGYDNSTVVLSGGAIYSRARKRVVRDGVTI